MIVLFANNINLGAKNKDLQNENKRYSNECELLKKEIEHLKTEITVYKLLQDSTKSVNKNKNTDFKFSICNFYLGMSRSEYKKLIKNYKETGKMNIWDNNIYCMFWFRSSNTIPVRETRYSTNTFQSKQEFCIIFDTQPQFKNDKLTSISFLIEPSFDNAILNGVNNKNILTEYISNIVGNKPINENSWESQTTKIVLKEQKIKSKYYDNIDTYYRITISRK